MPGTLNPACTTNPNGIDCEGSRFDWTVNVVKPDTDFLRDFVFSVGTAPDPSKQILECDKGWIITAGYNSFRNGGDTYNLGFNPRCLSVTGWYTFKQIFKDDGNGNLEVDFFILDQSGKVVACTDKTGAASNCEWVLHPEDLELPLPRPPLSIEKVGCPDYGWLANEEINDLPIDNTVLIVNGCGILPEGEGQITPTNTTCQQYANDTAATLEKLTYTTKGGKINSVAPGVFFYYTKFSGEEGDRVTITTLTDPTYNWPIKILNSQVVLYSDTCTKLAWDSLTVNTDGTAEGYLPSTGEFIVGVKYNPSSLRGAPVPTPSPPPTITYSYNIALNDAPVYSVDAAIDLIKR